MSLRSQLALTTMFGLASVLCHAQKAPPKPVSAPDSVVTKTGYVVKPYDEPTAIIPRGAVLHGSYLSMPKEVALDRDNYAAYLHDPSLQELVDKMTGLLPKDTVTVESGFFEAHVANTPRLPDNKLIQMSGWRTRHADDKRQLPVMTRATRFDVNAYQIQISELTHLDMRSEPVYLKQEQAMVETGRARTVAAPPARPSPGDRPKP